MLNNFLVKLGEKDVAKMPAKDNLFNLGTGAKLDTKRSEIFHNYSYARGQSPTFSKRSWCCAQESRIGTKRIGKS
jgi:hypothetical protein